MNCEKGRGNESKTDLFTSISWKSFFFWNDHPFQLMHKSCQQLAVSCVNPNKLWSAYVVNISAQSEKKARDYFILHFKLNGDNRWKNAGLYGKIEHAFYTICVQCVWLLFRTFVSSLSDYYISEIKKIFSI